MSETIKTEQTLLTGSIPAISGIEDPSQARMILYQAGRPVHAPMDNVGLATDTDLSTLTTDIQAGLTAQTRSRIVNGAMQISQENGNSPGTTNIFYAADQWFMNLSTDGVIQALRVQMVTPNGSKDRFRLYVSTADATLAATQMLLLNQSIEGSRVADFQWGTTAAKQVILRFGFRSYTAGTFAVTIRNSGSTRSYVALFTISAAQADTNTEQTFVIPGDTTGTWLTDTGIGVQIGVCVATGTTYQGTTGWQGGNILGTSAVSNGMGTATNTFYLYDVGLYLDPLATGIAPPWVMPDEAEELRACQRYYWKMTGAFFHFNGYGAAGTAIAWWWKFPATMRTTPTAANSMAGGAFTNCAMPVGGFDLLTVEGARIYMTVTVTGNISLVPLSTNYVSASARM